MNLLIEVTRTVLLRPAPLLAQVEYSYSSSAQGHAPGPSVLDFLSGIYDLNDRSLVENLYKGRSARLGMYHSDLQSLRLVQDRRAALVVDSSDANSFR